jgi:hypothetical protein
MTKSRRMRWAENVACMGKKRNAHRFWQENGKARRKETTRKT